MPEDNAGSDIGGEPNNHSDGTTPSQPPRNQNPPSKPRNDDTRQQEADAISKLEKNVKTGEWWLIGIGIATLLINTA